MCLVERIRIDEQHYVGRRKREVNDGDWEAVVCVAPQLLPQNNSQVSHYVPQYPHECSQNEIFWYQTANLLAGKA
jgi:hypothetical protein